MTKRPFKKTANDSSVNISTQLLENNTENNRALIPGPILARQRDGKEFAGSDDSQYRRGKWSF